MDNTLPLPDIFHKRVFRVPDYQRGYAWEKEQVGEFLDDLYFLGPRHHYTGTVVLCQVPDALPRRGADGTNYVETHIVDGQQRLTTVVLLLNELSRALEDYPDCADLAQGIRNNYIETKGKGGATVYKLSLNEDTDKFFKASILRKKPGIERPPVRSAERLWEAKAQIAKFLEPLDGESDLDHQAELTDLYDKVAERLHFNLYEVHEEAEVGVIFEVMNDRGKQLTNLEKVKNYLLYAASSLDVDKAARDDLVKAVNKAWAEILRNLMAAGLGSSANEDQLLQMHWIKQHDPQAKNWAGVKSVKRMFGLREHAEKHDELLSKLRWYAEDLCESSVAFCDARNPRRDGAFGAFPPEGARKDARYWSAKLLRIGVIRTFLPLLMAARQRWPSEPQKYVELVKLCEAFAFRTYRVGRAISTYREPAMFRLAYAVAHGMEFDEAVRAMKNAYGEGWARRAFAAFANAGDPSPDYGYEWGGLRYFLYEYEEHLAAEKGASPDVPWQEVARAGLKDTIEHVLLQYIGNRPNPAFEHEKDWQKWFTAAEHAEYVHDIGNLALTKWNPWYSNKAFRDKKGAFGSEEKCYAEAPFYQETEIAKQNDWTKESINARRAKLLAWARERWAVDFSDVDGAGAPEVEPDEEEMDDEVAEEGED